ncbi:MAG: lasso peptide biosynthesis B2 protein [Sulfurovum sp.]|nr:lasso peptide biosynthesis B2 protein [Sulfurovum sp.]
MIRKFKKFTQLSTEEKKLFFEAYVTLGKMRAAILTVSFKRLTRSLEHKPKQEEVMFLNEAQMQTAKMVGRAITRAATYTPWESACLAQSLTAQKMLQKRGIPGVFYLGVAKDAESKEKMKAHAWSQCGKSIITGGGGHEVFTVVSVFGWE